MTLSPKTSIKKMAINAIQDLPDDTTYENIFEVIFLQQQAAIGKRRLESQLTMR